MALSPPFGAKGQWVVLGGTDVSLDSYTYDASGARGSGFDFAPEVGNTTGVDGTDGSTTTTRSSGVAFGPRVGADIPIGDWLSAWIVTTFDFGFRDYDATSVDGENAGTLVGGWL